MLPQVTQGFPLPYGCNNRSINTAPIFTFSTLISCTVLAVSVRLILVVNVLQVPVVLPVRVHTALPEHDWNNKAYVARKQPKHLKLTEMH